MSSGEIETEDELRWVRPEPARPFPGLGFIFCKWCGGGLVSEGPSSSGCGFNPGKSGALSKCHRPAGAGWIDTSFSSPGCHTLSILHPRYSWMPRRVCKFIH